MELNMEIRSSENALNKLEKVEFNIHAYINKNHVISFLNNKTMFKPYSIYSNLMSIQNSNS